MVQHPTLAHPLLHLDQLHLHPRADLLQLDPRRGVGAGVAVVILRELHPGVDRILPLRVGKLRHVAAVGSSLEEVADVGQSAEVGNFVLGEELLEVPVDAGGHRVDGVVAKLKLVALLVVVDQHRALAGRELDLADVDGREEVLERYRGELLMRGVAEVVEHDERRREERVGGRARIALRRRHLARQRVLVHLERERGPARGLGDLDVLRVLRGAQDDEVRHAQRTGHLHEVLELVRLGLLEVLGGVRLHDVPDILGELLHQLAHLAALHDEGLGDVALAARCLPPGILVEVRASLLAARLRHGCRVGVLEARARF